MKREKDDEKEEKHKKVKIQKEDQDVALDVESMIKKFTDYEMVLFVERILKKYSNFCSEKSSKGYRYN